MSASTLTRYAPNAEIPSDLQSLGGACGPASIWLVLKRYGIQPRSGEIIERCGYSEETGCFAVCIADALVQFGLLIEFHTDEDDNKSPREIESYKRIAPRPVRSISSLLRAIDTGANVIVSYLEKGGVGHFSPLAGARANKLILPYSIGGDILKSEFTKRWIAPGILRQSIVISGVSDRDVSLR